MWSNGGKQYPILANSSMGLSELKILDAYIKNIATQSTGKKLVIFKQKELETLLGVSRINHADLEKRIDCLLKQRVPFLDGAVETMKDVALFERCELSRDTYGIWTCYLVGSSVGIDMLFSESEKKHIADRFDLSKKLSSRYSYLLYRYLEDNAEDGVWELSLAELKEIMGCIKSSYDDFKAFNRVILKKCKAEIFEMTGFLFDYELVRYIRKVTGIRFIIHNQEDDEERIIEAQKELSQKKHQENIDFLSVACDNEFSDDEIDLLFSILASMDFPKDAAGGVQIARYNYLEEKYKAFKIYANKKQQEGSPIRKRFDYFLKIIQNERNNQQ
jgi:hypothetical protein